MPLFLSVALSALVLSGLGGGAAYAATPGLFGILSGAQLARINPVDGSASPVGQGLSYEAVGQNLAAIDRTHGVYYLLGYNTSSKSTNLVGVNMTIGAVVTDVATPFILPGFFASGECFLAFSDARGKAVLAGQMAIGAPYTFVLMDTSSGVYSIVAQLNASQYGPVGYAPSVLVPDRDEYVVMYARNPGTTGEVLSLFSISLADGGVSLWDDDCGDAVVLDFDGGSGLVYGIGQDRQHNYERALFSFDPSGKNCTRVGGDITAFETLVVGEGAIDSSARVFYWSAMPNNATKPPFPPVNLIGTSLLDATTISAHPYAGKGDPAQLRFLN